jgi:hypothetical protein
MASHPKPSAKNEPSEYAVFEDALRKVLSVPKQKLQTEKRKKKAKTPSVSREGDAGN